MSKTKLSAWVMGWGLACTAALFLPSVAAQAQVTLGVQPVRVVDLALGY